MMSLGLGVRTVWYGESLPPEEDSNDSLVVSVAALLLLPLL